MFQQERRFCWNYHQKSRNLFTVQKQIILWDGAPYVEKHTINTG